MRDNYETVARYEPAWWSMDCQTPLKQTWRDLL